MASKRILPAFVLAILAALSMLGVTSAGFGPAQGGGGSGGGGFANPATEDLNMSTHAIVVGNAGSTIYDDADGGDHVLTLSGLTGLNLTAPYVNLGGSETFLGPMGEDLDMDGFSLVGQTLDTISITAGVGSPTALTAAQSGSLVTNTGTTVKAACTLPSAPPVGTFYDFLVTDADGLRVVGNTDQVITCGPLGASASAGYVESVRQFSAWRLTYTATNDWQGTRLEGTLRKDSTTSAGFAYTPTAWTSFTPTGLWDNTTYFGRYQQIGNRLHIYFYLTITGTPTSAAQFYLDTPSGFTIDEPALNTPYNARVGDGLYADEINTGQFAALSVHFLSSSDNKLYPYTSAVPAVAVTKSAPAAFSSDYRLQFNVTIPVQ